MVRPHENQQNWQQSGQRAEVAAILPPEAVSAAVFAECEAKSIKGASLMGNYVRNALASPEGGVVGVRQEDATRLEYAVRDAIGNRKAERFFNQLSDQQARAVGKIVVEALKEAKIVTTHTATFDNVAHSYMRMDIWKCKNNAGSAIGAVLDKAIQAYTPGHRVEAAAVLQEAPIPVSWAERMQKGLRHLTQPHNNKLPQSSQNIR